jgi:integrase
VRAALRAVARGRKVWNAKNAFRATDLERLLMQPALDCRDRRDRAIAAVGYYGLLRRNELAALQAGDIRWDASGSGRIVIRKITSQQPSELELRYLPPVAFAVVREWVDANRIKCGLIFRRFHRGGSVGERALHPNEIAALS